MHIEWRAIVLKSLLVFNAAEGNKSVFKPTVARQDVADLAGRWKSERFGIAVALHPHPDILPEREYLLSQLFS
jgi:hypothetical protein